MNHVLPGRNKFRAVGGTSLELPLYAAAAKFHMSTKHKHKGFTLIEMLITVAVIGILAAIALPAYNGAQRKAHRADAQSALMNIASRQQQMLVDTRTYVDSVAALNITLPGKVGSHYAVAIALGAGPAPTFVATATPIGDQTKDSCGALSIDQAGTKLPANCW